ncbi:hypothetical protein KSP39_PZI015100 [Platanthera zijinensis]|uniref:Uncharacterized protein n=1 Tax=Platanthera zijinensis TaxID=2320716 RepID=A0AAP0BBC6_9ASPA
MSTTADIPCFYRTLRVYKNFQEEREGDRPRLVTLDEMRENRRRVPLVAVLFSRPSAGRFLWE